ncbi:MAG: metallophosphoesterase [Oscillospiraceae bacterium]|jgi:predicted phosphodiesterase|nr:metallophosphoesterase [Oscillospiraceae bacterium]
MSKKLNAILALGCLALTQVMPLVQARESTQLNENRSTFKGFRVAKYAVNASAVALTGLCLFSLAGGEPREKGQEIADPSRQKAIDDIKTVGKTSEGSHDGKFFPTEMPEPKKCSIDLGSLAGKLAKGEDTGITESQIGVLIDDMNYFVDHCPPVVQFEMGNKVMVASDFHSSKLAAARWYSEARKTLQEGGSVVVLGDLLDTKNRRDSTNDGPVLVVLFLGLAMEYPNKVICLRGNHEMLGGVSPFSVLGKDISDENDMTIQDISIVKCVKKLPMAAITRQSDGGLVLFVHGAPPKLEAGGAEVLLSERFRHHSPETLEEFLHAPLQCIVWDRHTGGRDYSPGFWGVAPDCCPQDEYIDGLNDSQVRERLGERFVRVFIGHNHKNFDVDKVSMVCSMLAVRDPQFAVFNDNGIIERVKV